MVTADSPKARLHVLMNRAAPIFSDIHPLAPLVLMQVQSALDAMDEQRIVEQAHRLRDLTQFILAGGDLPPWVP